MKIKKWGRQAPSPRKTLEHKSNLFSCKRTGKKLGYRRGDAMTKLGLHSAGEEKYPEKMSKFKFFYKALSLLAWYAGVAALLVLFLLAFWGYRAFQGNQYNKPSQSAT